MFERNCTGSYRKKEVDGKEDQTWRISTSKKKKRMNAALSKNRPVSRRLLPCPSQWLGGSITGFERSCTGLVWYPPPASVWCLEGPLPPSHGDRPSPVTLVPHHPLLQPLQGPWDGETICYARAHYHWRILHGLVDTGRPRRSPRPGSIISS
jgi:hypothetical protein